MMQSKEDLGPIAQMYIFLNILHTMCAEKKGQMKTDGTQFIIFQLN